MKKIIGVLVVAVLIYFGYSALSRSSPPAGDAFSCAGCNVIIVGVDTLRADHVHALGYPRETTPTIDALAAHSYVFSNAVSPSNWTVPSFMSIMTGVYPSVHKVVNKYVVYDPKDPKKQILSNLSKLSPELETLAQALKKLGYATGGFTGDAGVGHAFGYSQGFDTYTDEQTFGGFNNSEGKALSWLDSLGKGQKFFMFFHGYDLHGQFNLPENERIFVDKAYAGPYTGAPTEEAALREEQLSSGIKLTPADAAFWTDLYDSKLRAADASLAQFFSELKKRGLLSNTVIVVVADHGEEYYEHGGIDHGQSLYDELVHVPLIISLPANAKGQVIPAQVTTQDIASTLVHILGVTPDSQYAKQIANNMDLLAYARGGSTAGADVFVETDYRDFIHERAVRTADGWKYIVNQSTGAEELYNLNTDPGEKTNLIKTETAKAAALRAELKKHIADDLQANPLAKPARGCLPVYPTECK